MIKFYNQKLYFYKVYLPSTFVKVNIIHLKKMNGMFLTKFKLLMLVGSLTLILAACGDDTSPKDTSQKTDTIDAGSITISVDESFKPVMDQQIKIFDSSFPNTQINVLYKPQEDCFVDLMNDSVRMVVAARDLTEEEKKYYKTNNIYVRSLAIAEDAIGVIINNAAQDSLMDKGILQSILKDNFIRKYNVVFDNAKSGIVRYIKDSLLLGAPFPANAYAVNNTDSVIDYVSKNKNAIGFVGVSHLYDPASTSNVGEFKNIIRVVQMKDSITNDFFKPYQAYIVLNQYPLKRQIFFHLRENYRGLGTGFANFLGKDRGQLIFRIAYLRPLLVPIVLREAVITE